MHSLQSPMDKKTTTTGAVRNVNVVLTDDNVSELSSKLNVDMKEYQVDRYYADPQQYNQKISLVSFVTILS